MTDKDDGADTQTERETKRFITWIEQIFEFFAVNFQELDADAILTIGILSFSCRDGGKNVLYDTRDDTLSNAEETMVKERLRRGRCVR